MKVRQTHKKPQKLLKAEAELQGSQGLQVSALRTSRGKALVSHGNEKVSEPPLMRRLRGKNVREMLSHLALVFLGGILSVPKHKLSARGISPAPHLGGTCAALSGAGDGGGLRGCVALAALPGAAPHPRLFSLPIPCQTSAPHQCRAFLLQTRGSVPPGGPAGPAAQPQHRRGRSAAGDPPEQGAGVINFLNFPLD